MSRARQAERGSRKSKRGKGARANSGYGDDTVVQFPGTEVSDDLAPKVKRDTTPIEARNPNQAYYLEQLNTKQLIFATGEAGCGKAQPLDARILTPFGWARMGDLRLDDLVICPDGSIAPVIGIYPQGKKDIYRVTFDDGRWTECCLEHLWNVTTGRPGRERMRWGTLNTEEIISKLEKGIKVHIPLLKPNRGIDQRYDIHPYVIGALLGDGGLTGSCVTFNKADDEIVDKVESLLPEHISLRRRDRVTHALVRTNEVGITMRELTESVGMYGIHGNHKSVPREYFRGSAQQRLELLQGLMDTDGFASKGGSTSFASSSEQLAKDVQYLVRSLGGIARITTKVPHYTYLGERRTGATSYIVGIRFPTPTDLFTLTRKKERVSETNQYSEFLRLGIHSVEKVGVMEAQCISVDHPDHLYITDDFIVTHNTFLSAARAAEALLDKEVERIIVTRPVLESGESLGFLPGDISEKFSPYFRPVQDILEKRLGGSFLQYCLRPDVKKVEIAPFAYMRGRTFENAVVILDEAQNVTKAQMKMFLTRLGENVTVIVNGDVQQCDLPKGVVSGLADALQRFSTTSRIGVVEFTKEDCVRSELCQEVLYAYEHD